MDYCIHQFWDEKYTSHCLSEASLSAAFLGVNRGMKMVYARSVFIEKAFASQMPGPRFDAFTKEQINEQAKELMMKLR